MNAVPPAIASLLDIFTTELADVRFGDVDAGSLGRLAAEVESLATAVASAQAALDAARSALLARQDDLADQAQRALAYARVYAERDDALSARLDAISLGRPRTARPREPGEALVLSPDGLSYGQPAKRPRGRPRKHPLPSPPALHEVLPLASGT